MTLAAHTERQIEQLDTRQRAVVEEGLELFARLLLDQPVRSRERLRAASTAVTDLASLLLDGEVTQLQRVERVLREVREVQDAESLSLETLEASGRLQILALYRAIEKESFTVGQLEDVGISRQRLKQLRDQGRLLGIDLPSQRGYLYPRWQFTPALRPKPFVRELLSAATEEGVDALSVHRILTRPGAVGEESLLDRCEAGDLQPALAVLRTTGELGG